MRLKIVVTLVILGMILASALVSGQHPLKKDTDGDGMPDGWEDEHGLNPNDAGDASVDNNYNGLTNFQEYKKGYDPWDKDTDDDGLSNYAESTGLIGFFTDPLAEDSDGDGLSDLEEICLYIDTGNETQVKEVYPDRTDRGSVRTDIIRMREKYPYKLDPTNSDVDYDGLSDGDEISKGTNPNLVDSDHDGLSDGKEVYVYGTDPKKQDTDGDGLMDSEEIFGTYGVITDPRKKDTDGDGIPDGEERLGFGCVPIEPSRHALTYEEFISDNKYANESITLKAKVGKIRHNSSLPNTYSILLKPLEPGNSGGGKRGIVNVESSWHYDFENDLLRVDDRFGFTLREGDTIVVVGKAGKFMGSTREITVDGGGKMFLVLTPSEAGERWLPSKDYVKIISREYGVTPSPSPSPSPSTSLTPTPVLNSSLALNTTPTPSPSPVNATINLTNELTSESDLKKEGEGILGLFIYVVIGFVITSLFLYAKFGRKKLKEEKREEEVESLWVVSDIQKKGEHAYEVAVNKEGKGATIELNEKLYKQLIMKKRLVIGNHTILISQKR
ncbi:MAG: hypothetical protein KAV25_04670 [Methanophagales archaeon]|nr:hypothetical protein [Methanophagales archaeon]